MANWLCCENVRSKNACGKDVYGKGDYGKSAGHRLHQIGSFTMERNSQQRFSLLLNKNIGSKNVYVTEYRNTVFCIL